MTFDKHASQPCSKFKKNNIKAPLLSDLHGLDVKVLCGVTS